jgi:hypothetical protein
MQYAHLGFQDVFYLARLQLSLPPSSMYLPRPTSPIRRVLVKAKYPLPPEFQTLQEDPRSSISDRTSVTSRAATSGPIQGEVNRGRDCSVKVLGKGFGGAPSLPTPTQVSPSLGPLPQSLSIRTPAPTSPGLLIPQREGEPRDHFNSVATSPVQLPPPLDLPEPAFARPAQEVASGSSTASGASVQGRAVQRMASGDETDVKRMLEARIKALVNQVGQCDGR